MYEIIKRSFDILIAIIGIIVCMPIGIIISFLIKITSTGKIIFKQERLGKNGNKIVIYKFRTMVETAESDLKKLPKSKLIEYKENYRIEDDSRITKIGNFLRQSNLDEIPQLWNILKGDLSLIGPRPVVEDELKKYGTNTNKFLSVTPGLTGFWAANGRSCTSYEQRMQMELFYIDNFSFKMDVKVFFKTISAVLKREGAV